MTPHPHEEGYFVFARVARTAEGSDGSGYVELKYVTHTFGRAPEEWLASFNRSTTHTELIFFKIADAIVLKPRYRTIPERTELVSVENPNKPITDLRWMT